MGLIQNNRDLDSSVLLWGVLILLFLIMAGIFVLQPTFLTNELLHLVFGSLLGILATAAGFFFRNHNGEKNGSTPKGQARPDNPTGDAVDMPNDRIDS